MELAFLSGQKEWADITLISKILRQCGGFFLDTKKTVNPLFKVIIEEFLASIMKKHHIIGY